MNERTESGAAIVVAAVLFLLLLLLAAGGTVTYFIHARQTAAAIAEARLAHQAATAANMKLQQARAQQEAREKDADSHAHSESSPLEKSSNADSDQAAIAKSIESMLQAQTESWNAGDIDGFMEHYWKSEELTFSSGGKTTRGWSATKERYRQRYPTSEEMGQLRFDHLEITPLSDSAALVLGEWHVKLSTQSIDGNFSLVVRKQGDRWLIVHDHTSRG